MNWEIHAKELMMFMMLMAQALRLWGLWKETSLTPLTGRIKIQHVQATVNVTALSLDFPVAADKRVVT